MHSSDTDVKDNTDVDNNSQLRQANTSPSTSNLSQSSSPSCSTLLVIDDNSNSNDSTTPNTNNIPIKLTPLTTAQTSHIPIPMNLPSSTHDIVNGTAEQQRRRNSSIAKLLGGHPLHNHQYEEINQQILEDQSAQNLTSNSDVGTDFGIQRSRSSITRTLLMNPERTNSVTKLSTKPQTSASRDFEYLIRQELDKLDTDHAPVTLQRNSSASKIFQNVNSSTNANAQSPTQSKLKRKRPMLKAALLPTPNIPPFSLHEPFELESTTINSIPSAHSSHPQNEFVRFDPAKRPRLSSQPHFNLPVNTSIPSQSAYPYSKMSLNSSLYNQLTLPRDCLSSNNSSHHSPSTKLTLPAPLVIHSSSSSPNMIQNNNSIPMTATCKAKSVFAEHDVHELPRQRSYSNTFVQSDSSSSSEPSVPLKKRLLHAYNNEHRPTTPL